MRKILGLAGAAALALGGTAVASHAGGGPAKDVAAMTCGDYFGMDDAGRETTFNAITAFVMDASNAAAAGAAAQMSAEQLTGAIATGCEGKDVSTKLLEAINQ